MNIKMMVKRIGAHPPPVWDARGLPVGLFAKRTKRGFIF
ncbi:hypothetical protein Solca_3947 [Solitalea canadensis DSM 3403]|uniref:Uncharacterized protein n=1 Tax=Solitalea canadensis (strain ATCC 29591 / DSM 3403 / JCM 21819 / LMG 8368 / NBRC 15130 / NCIMB 12057 / USAM 9D) TaxID=929556 RepID=H8KM20_SOLCM|nr:hypothetical protein Solca_3947 [Solitalea canadensis DSM 3403]